MKTEELKLTKKWDKTFPKSKKTDLFSFSLTEDEMDRINALDRGEKHDWY